MTTEQHYEQAKAEFIAASKAMHLQYDIYEPYFILAADCVRKAFKAEPIGIGKRIRIEYIASVALTAIMRLETDITMIKLVECLLRSNNNNIYYNMKQHYKLMSTCKNYQTRFNNALNDYKNI